MASAKEIQAINELASVLYEFLPGKAHPYADQRIAFQAVARDMRLGAYWSGRSKRPAIAMLLQQTLDNRKESFCSLITEIVNRGLIYRNGKGNAICREEIEMLNTHMLRLGFKIPELWSKDFLSSLPSIAPRVPEASHSDAAPDFEGLKSYLLKVSQMAPQARGYEFEHFLEVLFGQFRLSPRGAFRLVGEQIDGSFELASDTYLVEAKWQDEATGQSDLLVFSGKVQKKAIWARGLFVSYAGFTADGLEAFAKGHATNIIGMDGMELYYMLEHQLYLDECIKRKVRRATESGDFFVPLQELFV